jgi:hypothetical protein
MSLIYKFEIFLEVNFRFSWKLIVCLGLLKSRQNEVNYNGGFCNRLSCCRPRYVCSIIDRFIIKLCFVSFGVS